MKFYFCLSVKKKKLQHELNSKVVLQLRKLKGQFALPGKSFMKLGYVFCLARSNSKMVGASRVMIDHSLTASFY